MKVKCFGSLFRASVFSFISIVAIVCQAPDVLAAETDTATKKSIIKKVEFSGSLGFDQNFFNYQSDDTNYYAFRPPSQTLFYANAQIGFGRFSLPFSFSYLVQAKDPEYSSPIASTFRIKDLLNNYNNLSFSPTYKGLTVNIGTQVPVYSELTAGVLPVFGAGFSWKPKKFRVAAFYGTSARGINTDTLLNVPGSYTRRSLGLKLGYGAEEASHIHVIMLNHVDDKNSATVTTAGILPAENLVTSLDFKKMFGQKFFIQGEVAVSALSIDLNDGQVESDSFQLNVPRFLVNAFNPRVSSRYGAATNGSMGYAGSKWGSKISGKFYSSDYNTLNIPFLQTDIMEFLFEPYFRLFNSKFELSGSIGRRVDNLLANKISTTYQDLYSVNTAIRLTPNWSITAALSNFGMRNSITNDTFRIQNVNENLNVNSSYTISGSKTNHTLSASYSSSSFVDYNIVSGAFSNANNQLISASYSLGFAKSPIVLSISDSYIMNSLFLGDLALNVFTAGINTSLGKNKNINASLQGNLNNSRLEDFDADNTITVMFMLSCIVKKNLSIGSNVTYNVYRYGNQNTGINSMDNAVRLFASYTFQTKS